MITLKLARGTGAASLMSIKAIAWDHPGEHELTLKAGSKVSLALGDFWRYSGSPECVAALSKFGSVHVAE